jgi:serine/threonine-protein kinase
LTGKVPFEAASLFELCLKVAQDEPPNPKVHRPELPDELCAAVLRCLAKDPEARFANVGEVAHAFEPFALARNRGAAERALDVLSTGRRPPMRSVPDGLESGSPSIAPPAASRPGEASSGGAARSPLAEAFAETAAVPAAAITGAGLSDPVAPAAWGSTQGQPKAPAPKPKRGLPLALGALVALTVVGGLAGFAASRGGAKSGSAQGAAANVSAPSVAAANVSAPGAGAANGSATGGAATAVVTSGAAAAGKTEPAPGTSLDALAKHGPDAGARTANPAAKGSASTKGGRPGAPTPATAATPAPAPADPGDFLKVRE